MVVGLQLLLMAIFVGDSPSATSLTTGGWTFVGVATTRTTSGDASAMVHSFSTRDATILMPRDDAIAMERGGALLITSLALDATMMAASLG
jgi:hypothetical protein